MQIPEGSSYTIQRRRRARLQFVYMQLPIEFAWSMEQQLNTVVHLDLIDQGMLALPISCCVREYAHLMVRGGV